MTDDCRGIGDSEGETQVMRGFPGSSRGVADLLEAFRQRLTREASSLRGVETRAFREHLKPIKWIAYEAVRCGARVLAPRYTSVSATPALAAFT